MPDPSHGGDSARADIEARLPRGTTILPSIARVHFDGACQPARGGGVATYGFTVEGAGFDHEESGLAVRPWSAHATNNVAEYTAAIRALEWLLGRGFAGEVVALGDSELVVRQMRGEYAVRKAHLRAYWERLQTLARRFREVRFEWVPREQNARADALSKRAIEHASAAASRHRPATLPTPPADDNEEEPADEESGPGGLG